MGVRGCNPKAAYSSQGSPARAQAASAVVALPPSPALAPAFTVSCVLLVAWSQWQQIGKAKWCSALQGLCCCATAPAGLGVFLMGKRLALANCSFETFFNSSMRNNVRCHIRQAWKMCFDLLSKLLEWFWRALALQQVWDRYVHSEISGSIFKGSGGLFAGLLF